MSQTPQQERKDALEYAIRSAVLGDQPDALTKRAEAFGAFLARAGEWGPAALDLAIRSGFSGEAATATVQRADAMAVWINGGDDRAGVMAA